MLSNPTAFADVVVPHAKPANKQFLGKNRPTRVKSETARMREYPDVRVGRRLKQRSEGHGQSQGQDALQPIGWMLNSPFIHRQAPFFLQLASTKSASPPR
jgi:hypothetical protein